MNEYNIVIPEHRLVVMPVRKCACSSIKEALKASYPRQKMRILDNHEVAPLLNLSGYQCYGFVRNPFARMVSFHEHLIMRKGRTDTGWYDPLTRFDMRRDMPFRDMLELIATIPDDVADPHFRSVTACLSHNGELLPQWVGRVESLTKDWAEFQGRVPQIDIKPLGHRNKSAHPPWPSYYDEHTRALVERRYADDFTNFYPEYIT